MKVVEIGVWVAGPAAGGILADWGADVVKIEPPTGDPARSFQYSLAGPMPTNAVFELDNRSKRGIVLDLTTDEGRAVADELLAQADVFVTNIRVGALERLGLDPDAVRARHPHLVYGLITGFGLEGPDKDRPAYDVAAFWARGGIASLLATPGGPLPFQRGGMGDHSTGMTMAAAICAALVARSRTGEGQLVSTSLLRQGAYTVGFDVNVNLMWGHTIRIGQRETMGNPAMNNYTCADGKRVWLVGLEGARHWPPLCRALGHPEWIDDPRFADPRGRFENARELIAMIDEIFATKTRDEWAAVFETEPEVFWAPVNDLEDLVADEQFHAAGGLVVVPDDEHPTPMVATPADFHGTPWEPRALAPKLGQHTDEVLRELGRTPEQIDDLVARGVARRTSS